jgi:hypothetical protein
MPYIFLNPDGTQEKTLLVLVEAKTGVEYGHQCAGLANHIREAEGFLIPVGGADSSEIFIKWFWKNFRGNSYEPATSWTQTQIVELKELVASVVCWFTYKGKEEKSDARLFLILDDTRLAECTEGWIPVETPYGFGILIFDNCD